MIPRAFDMIVVAGNARLASWRRYVDRRRPLVLPAEAAFGAIGLTKCLQSVKKAVLGDFGPRYDVLKHPRQVDVVCGCQTEPADSDGPASSRKAVSLAAPCLILVGY